MKGNCETANLFTHFCLVEGWRDGDSQVLLQLKDPQNLFSMDCYKCNLLKNYNVIGYKGFGKSLPQLKYKDRV